MEQMACMRQLFGDRDAVTTLEYGIICAFFAVLLVGIFGRFGQSVVGLFTGISTAM